MKGDTIKYRKGYKYWLAESYTVLTKILGFTASTEWILLTPSGMLTIKRGYAWDGASGPTFDTKDSIRGSLGHDAGYQLIRLGLIPESTRPLWDDLLHDICVEDGMWHPRAELWEEAVSHFAQASARNDHEPEILEAP